MSDRQLSRRDLRCSDSDRERVAEIVREAAADGRLSLGELEERLEVTFSAKTYGDLEPIVTDLTAESYPGPARPSPRGRSERIVTILGSEKRRGRWDVPERIEVRCFLGDVTLDFTESIVRHRDVVVEAGIVLGNLNVVVPDGADVRLEPGTNILAERKSSLRTPAAVGGPTIHIRGFVVLGEIRVRPPRRLHWFH